jgi:Sulfatase
MAKLKKFLQTKPVFLYLLPVFFVFHAVVENFHYSIIKEAAELIVIYLSASLLIACLCWPLFRNFYKASLVAFFLMAFNFFFGTVHDFLKKNLDNAFILKYTFIIPAILLLTIILIIYLKKVNHPIKRFGFFLNSLFILLITIDIVLFLPLLFKSKIKHTANLTKEFIKCDSCARPDIYLIIADEYAGNTELKDIFSFDNIEFETKLKTRGFHTTNNTTSNYNATVYSMASMLSMDYIDKLQKTIINHRDMFICRDIIKSNNLTNFLERNGYEAFNFSPFGFADKKNFVASTFFVSKKELFISQTFTYRIFKEIGYHLATEKAIKAEKDKHLLNNAKIDSATRVIAQKSNTSPKFVYTHFALPHFPYYFDSSGKRTIFNTTTLAYSKEEKDYIQYLKYANNRLLALIDHIRSSSQNPPIIILMSDHGYRQFTKPVDKKYHFMNFNAVYLPTGNYSGFYDGMSNVNQFRVLLNTVFRQKLPLIKDSTSFLAE